jgi:protocatechuate 3,4-dioxygenase alpha subunit
MNHGPREFVATASQTIGPFFHVYFGPEALCGKICAADAAGEPIRLTCRVFDGNGLAIPDALIELWQANASGEYSTTSGFGRQASTADGVCVFETVRPGRVPGPNGQFQAPHINVIVLARGLLRHFHTRIYFAGETANAKDSALALVPDDRRSTLMAHPNREQPGSWNFEIHLSGERETVFFDI